MVENLRKTLKKMGTKEHYSGVASALIQFVVGDNTPAIAVANLLNECIHHHNFN